MKIESCFTITGRE